MKKLFKRNPRNTSGCTEGLKIDRKVKKTFTLIGRKEKKEERKRETKQLKSPNP